MSSWNSAYLDTNWDFTLLAKWISIQITNSLCQIITLILNNLFINAIKKHPLILSSMWFILCKVYLRIKNNNK
jgi:hypothetical protein